MTAGDTGSRAGEALTAEIRRFVRESPENLLPGAGGPFFDEPLVGFASAADPLFAGYKRIIGAFHSTPLEVMVESSGVGAGAETVVCWVLPISRIARIANRRERRLPAPEWALTRSRGEDLNAALRRHVVAFLRERGHRAVAPALAPGFAQFTDSPAGIASSWSERHAAHAAGLGTFSLNDGLITPRGIAHRLGSVVTDLRVEPTPRPYSDHHEYCLHFLGEVCTACIARCPVKAVSAQGHDKVRCREHVYGTAVREVGVPLGLAEAGCGLCQTRVPCEARIPPPPRRPRAKAKPDPKSS